ncbi:MAG: hypothetical protein WBV82_08315 [Myxococcaceae bacterium]
MGAFSEFLNQKGISVEQIIRASTSIETRHGRDRSLARERADMRRTGMERPYVDAGVEKPRSGRSVSMRQVQAALSNQPLPPKVRGKLSRAVNAVLRRRNESEGAPASLFGEVLPRRVTAS